MKKIILLLAVLAINSIILMAQPSNNIIYGGSVDQIEYEGRMSLGIKAICQYDYNTNLFSIRVVNVANDNGNIPVRMTGYLENTLPSFINEKFTTEGQVFYYDVKRSGYTPIRGTISFLFEGYSTTIPLNVGIDIR